MEAKEKSKEELIKEIERLKDKLKEQEDLFERTTTHEYKNAVVRWNSFFSLSLYQILILKRDGTIISTNFIPERNLPPDSIIGLNAYDFISPEFKEHYIKTIHKVLDSKKSNWIELQGKGPNGDVRWYRSNLYPVVDNDAADSVIVVISDITPSKEEKDKLVFLEARYRKLSEASFEGIVMQHNGKFIDANDAAAQMLGYTREELMKMDGLIIPVPEDRERMLERIKNRRTSAEEFTMLKKNGERLTVEIQTKEVEHNGNLIRVAAIRDVTESRKNRQEISVLQERFRKLSEAPFEAILIHENGNIMEMNDACINMFGYTREELLQMKAWELAVPEQRQILIDRVKNRITKAGEYFGLKKDGQIFHAELQTKETAHDDKFVRVVAIRDVSERKTYEMRLEQSKEDYESLVKNSPDGIFIHDTKGCIVFANPSAMKIAGIKNLNNALGRSIYDFILPEFHKIVKSRGELLKKGKDVPFSKIKIKKISSGNVSVEYKPVAIKYRGKDSILVVYHNIEVQEKLVKEQTRAQVAEETNILLKKEIAQRKEFEKQLRSSEEKYRDQSVKFETIIESSSHMFWTTNKKMELISYNYNFEKLLFQLYGAKPRPGTNISAGKFISSPEANKYWMEKSKNAFNGKSEYFETSLKNKKGQRTWLEVNLNPIRNEQGKIVEVSGIAHDITEKKQSEETLKMSLLEKEVLLKEVHHRVKNNLQVISSILNLQSTYVKDEKTLDILKESQNRIKSMSFIHESLYRNKDFSNINFQEYVRNLTNNLLVSYSGYSKKITLRQRIDDVFLNLDIAIPLGLIINELMSNALKYAYLNKDKGRLEVSVEEIGKSRLKLVVSDDGSGIPSTINFRKTESLGLQLVNILVDQLRGKITLDNSKGTKFTITFDKESLKI